VYPHAVKSLLAAVIVASVPMTFVIPAGQEAATLEMLGGKDKLPGGCVLEGASIQSNVIDATYKCGADVKKLRLAHPSTSASSSTKTQHFVLTTDLAVETRAAIEARIRKGESTFKWQEVTPASPSPSAAPPPVPSSAPSVSQQASSDYERALELYRKGMSRDAFVIYRDLARRDSRQPGVLGMLVATLAGSQLSEGEVKQLIADAEAAPSDPLPQFLAGVASHYYAHEEAGSVDEKRAWYTTALRYLDRAKTFDFEARWHIYEAVTHFRLGHQAEAEAIIEKAVALGSEDPDVYYCRAEIFQRTNIPRSLEDIRKYQQMVAEIVRKGGTVSPAKAKRVEIMYAHLLAVSRGEVSPKEIFDPVATSPLRRWKSRIRDPRWFAGAIAAVAAVGLILARVARRRRMVR
jgi:tetratricopeptide (TPR) repeat protein